MLLLGKYRQKYLQSAQYFDLVNFCNKKWDNRVKRYHTRKLWNRHHRFKNDVWYMMIRIVKQFNQVRLCTLFFFCHFVDNGWIVISLSHFYCWNFAYEVNDSYIKCVNRFLSFCSLFFSIFIIVDNNMGILQYWLSWWFKDVIFNSIKIKTPFCILYK